MKAAVDYLLTRSEVDHDHLYLLGICQGVNWAIQATTEDRRIEALSDGIFAIAITLLVLEIPYQNRVMARRLLLLIN